MDKRTLLAAALMALVIVLTPRLFSSRSAAPTPADTSAASAARSPSTGASTSPAPATQTPAVPSPNSAPPAPAPKGATHPAERAATLNTPRATLALMNPGASPGDVALPGFRDLRPGVAHGSPALIAPVGQGHLIYRLATGRDTIALDTLQFTVTQTPNEVTFASAPITLTYRTTSGRAFDSR